MSGQVDLDNPDVQRFLQLLAEILAENFLQEHREAFQRQIDVASEEQSQPN